MISQTAEYALRAVVFLAGENEVPRTTREIAVATRVPAGYLCKVLNSLVRGGVVRSQRGVGGGSVLARPPEELSVYEVIQAVEPIQRIRHCPLGLEAHRHELCPLHSRLDQALAAVEASFRSTMVSELVAAPRRRTGRCAFPCAAATAAH